LFQDDRQPDLNPMIIEDKELFNYGFKYLFEIDTLKLNLKIMEDKK